jgi:hypothetical protein
VQLRKLDITIGQSLDIDAKVIGDVTLVFHVKVPFHLTNCFGNFLFIRSGKDSIVGVHGEDDVTAEEDTLINFGLFEANGLQSLDKMLVPYSSSLFLTKEVFEKFEHIGFSIAIFCFNSHMQLYIYVEFDVCLGVCQDKINLMGVPVVENREDKEEFI